MKSGLLIINHYVKSEKFHQLYEMFLTASKKIGCHLKVATNTEVLFQVLSGHGSEDMTARDFILFWDKDLLLARLLEEMNLKLYNSASAIEKCDDKGRTFIELYQKGIRQPKTFLSPKIFHAVSEDLSYFREAAEEIGFPLIVKENRGSFGFQVYLIENEEAYFQKIRELGNRPFLIQEFVASSRGRDLRLQIVGKEVAAAVLRKNPDDFRANATNGGKMYSYQPAKEEMAMALQAAEILQLDFAGVDILFGKEEEPILCEVNSNAHLVNLYQCTQINVAEKILSYILKDIDRR